LEISKNILTEIENVMPNLSKSHKAIANYILEHYEKAAYYTAAKLGAASGVSEATAIRFSIALNYKSYSDLQADLQEVIQDKLTTLQRIEISADILKGENILAEVIESDINKLKYTLENIDKDEFDASVDLLLSAKKIYIVGAKNSEPFAKMLGHYLDLILGNIKVIEGSSMSEMFEQILQIDSEDVVIAISYPKYSQSTINAASFAKSKKAKIIAITENVLSPLCELADTILIAKSNMIYFMNSMIAPMSLINALIAAVGMKRKEDVCEKFEQLETVLSKCEYKNYRIPIYTNKDK
jgi:DNA-binding MurR/RpiR family transcriptional regulator